jgi:hypothetical protein
VESRFIPKDPAVPSIIPKVLESLADFIGEYDRDSITELMDL